MKKKSILSVSVLVIILSLSIIFNSCKENSVDNSNSDYVYDQPRFDWKVTIIPNGDWIYDLWSPDTNEVFMTSWYNHLLYFKDGQITQMNYGANIKIACVDGLNKNEGYIVGSEVKNEKYTPHIERWNGSSFSNVPINFNFNDEFYTSHILVKSSNEIWISSPKGLIYNFDGYNLTQYRLPDTNLISLDIISGENGRIQYITVDFDSIIFNDKHYVYEFDGNSWSKIFEEKSAKFYGAIKNMIYAFDYPYTIYKIVNNSLTPIVYIPSNAGIQALAGNSFENIIGFGSVKGRYSFIHWNGQKWSDENIGEPYLSDILTRKMVNDDYFCAVNSGFIESAVLYRAFKKH